ncbi:uncharacterized protein V6R79_007665 [Siganus canaliculatus]
METDRDGRGQAETDGDGRGQMETDGDDSRNPFADVNKIKEPDMMKHEEHHKGNVFKSRSFHYQKQ